MGKMKRLDTGNSPGGGCYSAASELTPEQKFHRILLQNGTQDTHAFEVV